MANINIFVREETGLFTIDLDTWEWQNLYVNGQQQGPINRNDTLFEYNQTSTGPVLFVAEADENIKLINPGNLMYLKGMDPGKTYVCMIDYKETTKPKVVTLTGLIVTIDRPFQGAQSNLIHFSQGGMTGKFQTIPMP